MQNSRRQDYKIYQNEEKLFRRGVVMRIIMLGVLSVFTVVYILGCSMPSEPQLPQWDVKLVRVPILGADTISVGEQIDDPNIFPMGADSLYHIQFNGTETINVANQLKQESVSPSPFTGKIGNFSVAANPGQLVTVGILDAFPFLAPFGGQSRIIPAGYLPTIEKGLTLSNYTSVTFISGTVSVGITNNLNFPLGKPITIKLYDITRADTVGTVSFADTIARNGGTANANFNLAGKQMSNNLKVIISGHEDGTGLTPIVVNLSLGFNVSVSMSNLVASSATANIPNQNFGINQSVDINTDSIKVKTAAVSSGTISLQFNSSFPFPVQLSVGLTDIKTGVTPITRVITIPASGSITDNIDLAGKTIILGTDGRADFAITAATQSNNNSYTISANDSVKTRVTVSNLVFSSVTADVNIGTDFPSFDEDVVELDIDVPDIRFDNVIFTFVFSNVPADINIALRMVGTKSGKVPVIANYSFSLNGDLTSNTVVLTNTGVTVNGVSPGSGSGIVNLINLLPEHISFSGSARIDDDNAVLTTAPIGINYTVDVPFVYSLPSGAELDGDTLDIQFDSEDPKKDKDMRDIIRDYFKGGFIFINITNGIPMGGTLTLYAADSLTALTTPCSLWPVLSTFDFNPAPTNPTTGDILPIPSQELSLGLTQAQVQILSNSRYGYWTVQLDSIPKGSLHSTDKILLNKGFITGTLTVNSDLFDRVGDIGDNKTNKSSAVLPVRIIK